MITEDKRPYLEFYENQFFQTDGDVPRYIISKDYKFNDNKTYNLCIPTHGHRQTLHSYTEKAIQDLLKSLAIDIDSNGDLDRLLVYVNKKEGYVKIQVTSLVSNIKCLKLFPIRVDEVTSIVGVLLDYAMEIY